MPRIPIAIALAAALAPVLLHDEAHAVGDVIEETVQRHLDRFEECRGQGIGTITACYKGWAASDAVTETMVKCIGADLVPGTVTKQQRDCIWIDVSTEEDVEGLLEF